MSAGVVFNNISQVIALLEKEIKDIIHDEPYLIKNDIESAMNKPHSGRIYVRRSIQHQASAPGEAPAIDTSGYIGSIQVAQSTALQSSVQSNAEQSLALEFGRPERNLKPRPAWVPAAKRSVKRINTRLAKLKGQVERV